MAPRKIKTPKNPVYPDSYPALKAGRRPFIILPVLFAGLVTIFTVLLFGEVSRSLDPSLVRATLSVKVMASSIVTVVLLTYFFWFVSLRRDQILRRRAEKALLHLAAIVEFSDDAIIGETLDGIVTSWNRAAQRMYGYTDEEILGRPASVLAPPEKQGELRMILERSARCEVVEQFETRRICKDGAVIDVSVTVSPIVDDRGRVIGVSTIARNITERKKLEVQRHEETRVLEQSAYQLARREKIMASLLEDLQASYKKLEEQKRSLQEANARLESLSKLKDEFVATASHELRTPLTAIREGISLIHDRVLGPINEEQSEFLAAVDENIDRLTELIDNILDLAKIEAGRLVLARKRVVPADLIRSVLDHYRPLAGRRTLRTEIADVPDVFADPNRVLQVLWNLFSNAIKFTKEDGTITFRISRKEAQVTISVKDDGPGISKEDQTRLFQKFSQVGAKTSRGTGLGLALSKEIVQLHRGDIGVSGEPGRGSEFFFTLPVFTREFALQQCFGEQIEVVHRHGPAGKGAVSLLVFNAGPFLPGQPEDGVEGNHKRLEQVGEFFKRHVYATDAVLLFEPRWVVMMAATDMAGAQAMKTRLLRALDDWHQTLAQKPDTFSGYFGIAVSSDSEHDVMALFDSAKAALEIQGAPRHG